jgi:hypothetical protein
MNANMLRFGEGIVFDVDCVGATFEPIEGRRDVFGSPNLQGDRIEPQVQQTNYLTTILIAAASSGLAGRLSDAQKSIARLRDLDPALRLANVKDWAPFRRPEDLARFENGLQKAGLPE